MAAGLGINPPKRELLDKPVSGFGQGVKKLQKACFDDSHALRGPGLFTAGPLPSPPGTTGGSFNQNRSCQFVNSIAVSPPTQWLKPHLDLYQTMIQRGFGAPLSRIKPLFGRSGGPIQATSSEVDDKQDINLPAVVADGSNLLNLGLGKLNAGGLTTANHTPSTPSRTRSVSGSSGRALRTWDGAMAPTDLEGDRQRPVRADALDAAGGGD